MLSLWLEKWMLRYRLSPYWSTKQRNLNAAVDVFYRNNVFEDLHGKIMNLK
jgi:hypothetical protein